MANLARYSGTQQLPGVRRPQVIADTAVGEATTALGKQIRQSASQIGELADVRRKAEIRAAHQYQIDNFEGKRGLLDFLASVPEMEAEAAKNMKPGGVGYQAGVALRYDEGTKVLIANTPQSARPRIKQLAEERRPEVLKRAEKTEREHRDANYKKGIAEGLDGLLKTIRSNPATYEEAFKHGEDLILESGLVPVQKESLHKAWKHEAQAAWLQALPVEERLQQLTRSEVDSGSLIRGRKKFSAEAYADGDQYRIGYGQDTVTRKDGKVVKVVKDTVISKEDAERVRARYIGKLETTATEAVGVGTWDALPPRAQAVLTSIVDSYGKFPDSLLEAVQTREPEKIALAIEGLKEDNGGENAGLRQEEADIVRGWRPIPNRPGHIDALTYEEMETLRAQAQREREKKAGDRQRELILSLREDPQSVDRDEILNDPQLDDEQKGETLSVYDRVTEESRKDDAAEHFYDVAPGWVDVNNPDDTALVERAFKVKLSAGEKPEVLLMEFPRRFGVLPKRLEHWLTDAFESHSPALVSVAYQAAFELNERYPDAVRRSEGMKAIWGAAELWGLYRYKEGMSSDAAANAITAHNHKRFQDAHNKVLETPEYQRYRKGITLDSIKKRLGVPYLGDRMEEEWEAYRQYVLLAEDSYMRNGGNTRLALEWADSNFLRTWKKTRFSMQKEDGKLMEQPAEFVYPPVDGSHDYLDEEVKNDLATMGVTDYTDVALLHRFDEKGTDLTLEQLRSGKTAEMEIYYKHKDKRGEEKWERVPHPFKPDLAKYKAEAKAHKDAETVPDARKGLRRGDWQQLQNDTLARSAEYELARGAALHDPTPENLRRLDDANKAYDASIEAYFKAKSAFEKERAAERKKAEDGPERARLDALKADLQTKQKEMEDAFHVLKFEATPEVLQQTRDAVAAYTAAKKKYDGLVESQGK